MLPRRLAAVCGSTAVVATVALFATGKYGVSNDTFTYVSTASDLAIGGDYRAADGHVPTEFAPLYVCVLALLLLTPMSSALALGLVNGLAMAVLLAIIWCWARDYASPRWSLCAVAVVAAGAPVVTVVSYGWSEPLFMAFVTGALWQADRLVRLPKSSTAPARLIIAVGAPLAAACLTRYAGAIAVLAVALTMLSHRRWRTTVVVSVVALLPISLYVLRNALSSEPAAGSRGPAVITLADSVGRAMAIVGKWFVGPLPGVITATALVVAVMIVVLRNGRHLRQSIVADPAALFVVAYFLAIVVLAGAVTGISPPNDRLLAPLFPPLVIMLLAKMAPGWSRRERCIVVLWASVMTVAGFVVIVAHAINGVNGPLPVSTLQALDAVRSLRE